MWSCDRDVTVLDLPHCPAFSGGGRDCISYTPVSRWVSSTDESHIQGPSASMQTLSGADGALVYRVWIFCIRVLNNMICPTMTLRLLSGLECWIKRARQGKQHWTWGWVLLRAYDLSIIVRSMHLQTRILGQRSRWAHPIYASSLTDFLTFTALKPLKYCSEYNSSSASALMRGETCSNRPQF